MFQRAREITRQSFDENLRGSACIQFENKSKSPPYSLLFDLVDGFGKMARPSVYEI